MSAHLRHKYVFIRTGILTHVHYKVHTARTSSPLYSATDATENSLDIRGKAITAAFRCTTGHGVHTRVRTTGCRFSAAIPEQP